MPAAPPPMMTTSMSLLAIAGFYAVAGPRRGKKSAMAGVARKRYLGPKNCEPVRTRTQMPA
jgi:hypothetical protein